MRLSDETRQIIRDTTAEIFGPDAHVILFGCRVNDAARGGDIDLLVVLGEPATALDRARKSPQVPATRGAASDPARRPSHHRRARSRSRCHAPADPRGGAAQRTCGYDGREDKMRARHLLVDVYNRVRDFAAGRMGIGEAQLLVRLTLSP